MFPWMRLILVLAVAALVCPAAAEPLPRSVLVLDQGGPGTPWPAAHSSALRLALNADAAEQVAFYFENLDLGRFNDPKYEATLRTYLQEKYRQRPIGVIVAVGSASLEIVVRLRAELWPQVPIVFSATDEATFFQSGRPAGVTGTIMQLRLQDAVTAARTLEPNLKRIALVGTRFERDPYRRHFSSEIVPLKSEMEFIDLLGMPLAEVRKRVATLPDDSVIYFTSMYDDGTGMAVMSRDAMVLIAGSANRPIVVDAETSVGVGATGGMVMQPEPVGQAAARLVLRVLNGEDTATLPVTKGDFARPVFDWRQLQRWKISEARLPPGSEIRFRPPTMWEQYRWQMTMILVALLLQAAVISWLLFERHRRRRAELESRGRMLEVIHLNRTAAAGALSASIGHELNQPLGSILSNAEAAELLLAASPPDVVQLREILGDIKQADLRAAEIIQHLRQLLKRKTVIEVQEFDLNDAIARAMHILSPEARKRDIALSANGVMRPLPVRADQVHLEQVILNLATNGMDSMNCSGPRARSLSFQTALAGRADVEVSVADSGTGIPQEKLKDVFETFYTTKQEGTGLGLSIARTIVETYGGRIWAENRSGGGAVFRFTLPLSEARPAAE